MRMMILLSLVALAACDQAPASDAPPMVTEAASPKAGVSEAKLQAARAQLRSDRKVRDFVLDPAQAVLLQVAVDDDGTRRYGLAESYCLDLKDWGLMSDDAAVRIVDAAKVEESQGDFRSISLGTVRCRDGARWD